MKSKNIAIAGEITPSKTIIPLISRLKELDKEDKLNFKINKIIGLYHGESSKSLLETCCSETYDIGEGRRGEKKNSNAKLAYLISKDIIKAFNALRGKKIDLLITAGNAGDVRKAIVAANLLKIPVIHIEQDIYNPIEVISYANIVTVPEADYKEFLERNYSLKNVVNIKGYPMVKYLSDYINEGNLKDKEDIYAEYCVKDFVLLVLGGDLKDQDIEPLIRSVEELNLKVLIAPYRFDRNMVKDTVISPNVKVLDQYVDLLSYINASSALIYAAGMGMTIEAAYFNKPSIKIEGFHTRHASVDLAHMLNIPIVSIDQIPDAYEGLSQIDFDNSGKLLKNAEESIEELVKIVNEFDKNKFKKSGFGSTKNIWNSRKEFR